MKKGVIIFFLVFILGISNSLGQTFSFKHVSTSNGLSNSWVRCLYQDSFGFIWIGTSDGLNRYDGKNINVYRPTTENHLPLGNVHINDIIEKNDTILWVATDMGLYTFNMINEELINDSLLIPHPVLRIAKDHTNSYWFGTNYGLVKYNAVMETKTVFSTSSSNNLHIENDYITRITFDSNNTLWVGTKKGLMQYDPASNSFKSYSNNQSEGSISGDFITCIYEDRQKRLWVGTSLNGLNLVHHTPQGPKFQKVLEGAINDLYADQQHRLWVGLSSNEGIKLIDLNTLDKKEPSIQILKNSPLDRNSLSDNAIVCFYEDHLHDLWIGTLGSGVNYYSSRTKAFHNILKNMNSGNSIQNNLVNALYDDGTFLWIGTEGGLDRYEKATGRFHHYANVPNDPHSLASNPVLAINKDSFGNLWIGTWGGGLHRYNYKTDSFKRYVPDDSPGSIGSGNVFSIQEDSTHNLWIATVAGGLNKFDYQTEKFTVYRNDPADPNSLSGRSMSQALITSKGKLYVMQYLVVDLYDYSTEKFSHYVHRRDSTQNYGNISSMFEDSNKNLWLCTNAGLELVDSMINVIRRYTTLDGLPNNTIQAILEDSHKNLWISTNNGLSKFIDGAQLPAKPQFVNFTAEDGLPANEFKNLSATKNQEGIMYFGSSNGLTWFHPDSISLNRDRPNLLFTELYIQQTTPNNFSTYKPYGKNLNLIKQIELYYPNTDFIVHFSALNYLNAEENQYQYKLDGYDTEWVSSGNTMFATYTNIPEGHYTFRVKGSNNDGYWSKENSIDIKIYPVWWKSNYFKVIVYIFILLLSLFFIINRYVSLRRTNKELEVRVEKRTNELSKLNALLEEKQSKILEQNLELEEHRHNLEELIQERTSQLEEALKKAEESDHLKSAFLANMSHEIRTPMNAIIGFSTMLADGNISEEKRDRYIQQIKTNGKNLNVLIKDIIDISLIEAGQMVLSKSEFSVQKIMLDLLSYFELENKNRLDFVYLNKNSSRDAILYNDAVRFRQVMVNLLSNAFKYTDRGKIEYGYEIFETEAQFFVSDTGIGIHSNEAENIFKHFYKSYKNKSKSKLYRGTGIGLAICMNLVTQMGGKIWVESRLSKGSKFYFTLPVRKK